MTAKILCIDDEPEIRRDIAEELEDSGYATIEAGDGAQGLDAIVKEKPDLVVCDITMPVMDGHALLTKLREEHPEKADLPFVFLSALADREHILKGRKLGADDYLTKPVDLEILLATVESRLNQVRRMEALKQEQLVKLYKAAQDGELPCQAHPPDMPKAAVPLPTAAPVGAEENKQRLMALAKGSSDKLVGGRVQVIEFGEIRQVLGDRWEDLSTRVGEFAEATIRRRVSDQDIVQRTPEGEFLICFATLTDQEASLKASAISREIKAKICGSEQIEPKTAAALEVRGEAHEVPVTEAELAQAEDPLALMMGRIKEAAEKTREIERQVITELVAEGAVEPLQVVTAKGTALQLAQAAFTAEARQKIQRLLQVRPGAEDLLAELDNLRLSKVAELLCANALDDSLCLIVPVEFSTLDLDDYRDRFVALCDSLPEVVRSRLAFNVRNVPDELLSTRTASTSNHLRPYCRILMFELNRPAFGNLDPGTLRTKVVCFDFQRNKVDLAKAAGEIKRLAGDAHRRGCKLIAYNVASDVDEKAVFDCGIDMMIRRP